MPCDPPKFRRSAAKTRAVIPAPAKISVIGRSLFHQLLSERMRCTGGISPLLLRVDQLGDVGNGIEIVGHCLMRLNLDLKSFLEKYNQLKRCERVEDAACD